MHEPLKLETSRDMQLLHEIAQTPHVTQRDLAKRIGVALGLTNLMLRRLSDKGYIKIVNANKSRIGYQITSLGALEKSRLTGEFIRSSLSLYSRIRHLLREELSSLKKARDGRVVLCGTDELAEIASLTIQQMGLHLVAILSPSQDRSDFLGHPIRKPWELEPQEYDCVVLVSMTDYDETLRWLTDSGIPKSRILSFSFQGVRDPLGPQQAAHALAAEPSSESAPLVPSETDVVILCGGKGTRLGSLTTYTPKPLLPVGGYPFLLRLILNLKSQGFTRFILAAHYLSDQFEAFLSDCAAHLPEVELVIEPEPLGTGGALCHAVGSVRSATFIALNGDTWCSQPLVPVLTDHQRAERVFTVVAVAASNVEGGAFQKGVWRIGLEGNVEDFTTEQNVLEGWVNAGIYVLDRSMVGSWPEGRYSLEENLPALLNGKEARVFCSSGSLLDIGTPQTYEQAGRILQPFEPMVAIKND